jgi:2-oxoglutarate dehydrogenase E1 component
MLRHLKAVSSLADFSDKEFQTIIDDNTVNPKERNLISRVVLCTGKVYWDLFEEKKNNNHDNTAIVRIEQLYPFDADLMKSILSQYPNLKQVVWVQEEPQNMGAWNFLALKLMNVLPDSVKLFYVGRKESASTATGLLKVHLEEQSGLVKQAFGELS